MESGPFRACANPRRADSRTQTDTYAHGPSAPRSCAPSCSPSRRWPHSSAAVSLIRSTSRGAIWPGRAIAVKSAELGISGAYRLDFIEVRFCSTRSVLAEKKLKKQRAGIGRVFFDRQNLGFTGHQESFALSRLNSFWICYSPGSSACSLL